MQEARVEVATRDTSDFQHVVLNLEESYLADGVTMMYQDGGKLKNLEDIDGITLYHAVLYLRGQASVSAYTMVSSHYTQQQPQQANKQTNKQPFFLHVDAEENHI